MEFSVPMALADFVPVILFLIGTILLQRELYPRLSKGQFALFAAGTIDVFCAGALKAVYKLLYALGVCDFTKLNEVFFPVQSIGFLLAGLAMAAFLFYKPKKTTVCGVAAAPAVYGRSSYRSWFSASGSLTPDSSRLRPGRKSAASSCCSSCRSCAASAWAISPRGISPPRR